MASCATMAPLGIPAAGFVCAGSHFRADLRGWHGCCSERVVRDSSSSRATTQGIGGISNDRNERQDSASIQQSAGVAVEWRDGDLLCVISSVCGASRRRHGHGCQRATCSRGRGGSVSRCPHVPGRHEGLGTLGRKSQGDAIPERHEVSQLSRSPVRGGGIAEAGAALELIARTAAPVVEA